MALVGLIAAATPAGATTITYTATDAGSPVTDGFKFDFTVTNDTLTDPIGDFWIEFSETDFVALLDGSVHPAAAPSATIGWLAPPPLPSPIVSDPAFGFPGIYEAFADPGAKIAPSASLGGFTVWAQLADTGPTTPEGFLTVPDRLYFNIFDPVTLDVIDEGYATLAPVPLPATFPLLLGALGWLGLGGLRRRRANTA